MKSILDEVNYPKDLKHLGTKEKEQLAEEIREFIIKTVSKTGGHLASNLGVVELTISLHSIFDTPKDKIIWDVGHQTYVHKILTGRKNKFNTLRQYNGLSGFPKANESEYDVFDTGHSSSSISIASGLAKARDLKEDSEYIVSVIGDGALTGGMAFEALNDVGSSIKKNFIVILNDNEMSISKNVGGLSKSLAKIRTKKFYRNSNYNIRKICEHIPFFGNKIIRLVSSIKYGIMKISVPNMLFEDLGFRYLGPVDGNNITEVENILKLAKKEVEKPVLIHIITKKGKGYKIAEDNPDKYHSTPPFDIKTGKSLKQIELENNKLKSIKDYSEVFGDYLIKLAKKDNKIVAVTAAMADGTGLSKFKTEFKNRFFDVGIAEQNAITMCSGLAKSGLKPFVSIYSSFYQRCYDQVISDICLQNLPVVMCVDRAGVVGQDGETHQGIFDLSFFNPIPNLTVASPKDFKELELMLDFANTCNKPIVIRYPRGSESLDVKFDKYEEIIKNKVEIIQKEENAQITIIALGKMVARAVEVSNILKEKDINANVINARFLDYDLNNDFIELIKNSALVVTIEDGIITGGLGSNTQNLLIKNNLQQIPLKIFGYPKNFIQHGTVEQLEKHFKLDKDSIAQEILACCQLGRYNSRLIIHILAI